MSVCGAGLLMVEGQKAFDRWAIPACPEQASRTRKTDISQFETDISQFETDISQFETGISQFQ